MDAVPLVQSRSNRLAIVVLLCLLIGSVVGSIAPESVKDVGPLLLVVGHTTAGILFLTRARLFGTRDARAWKTIGAALFFGAGGVLLVGALTIGGVDVPAFGPTDLVFLTGYAAVVRALVLLARNSEEGGQSWKVTLIDTAVGAVALSIFVWIGIGHGLIDTLSQADTWSKVMAPLYPLVDVAMLLGVMAMALRRSALRLDPRLMVFAIGLGIQVLADLFFFAEGIGQSFSEAGPRIELFLLASACYVTVGIMAGKSRNTREYPERTVSVFALVWPYTLGAGVIALHVASLLRLGIPLDEQVTLIGSIAVGLLVTVRQTLAIRAMRSRVEDQRRELISSVSHELRTPLTGLIGYLGLLAGQPGHFTEAERQEMIEVASDEASHLGRIITDMVAMARNDGKDLPISVGVTTLADICELAVQRAEGAHAQVRVDSTVEIEVDSDRLAQALANLLNNADKYGGDAVILVGTMGESRIELEVHDNGPGVPVRYQERIWDQFERGQQRLNSATPGMGVGLAIVKAIAHAHGGSAAYRHSELLGGACFWISIPTATARVAPLRAAVPVLRSLPFT